MPDLRTWRTVAMGRRGAVASNHPLATDAGLSVLKNGGNAFDAAVAVATTIAVVEPHSNGVGGDAFFLLWKADEERATVIHAASPTAAAATAERYRAGIPHTGPLAAMPPGAPAGWLHLVNEYGTRPAKDLFKAAVHYAREGFPASRRFCQDVNLFQSALAADAGCSATYLKDGAVPTPGTTIKNAALARTLEALAFGGDRVLFGGEVGAALADFIHERGGLITLEDLARHHAEEREPLSVSYRGLTVLNAAPPSMGFALLLELKIAEAFELSMLHPFSADLVHTLVEVKKLAFAEREEYAGDPAHVDAPMAVLLGEDHGRELAARIDPARAASVSGRPTRSGDTTYFCVVDGWGNAVSGIQSIANPFGAACLDPKTGILLNSRMVWFHTDPDHPNVVAPLKHVRNTINPPMAIKDGSVRAVWGTPGGDAQVQVNLQTLLYAKEFGFDPQQALEAPRWTHFQPGTGSYYPHVDQDQLVIESRYAPDVLDELRKRGHNLSVVGPLEGSCAASMILRDPGGLLSAGADPRRDGWAAAF
jgi:gamma-glutamyltranspeptidase/glutathione hydrolase